MHPRVLTTHPRVLTTHPRVLTTHLRVNISTYSPVHLTTRSHTRVASPGHALILPTRARGVHPGHQRAPVAPEAPAGGGRGPAGEAGRPGAGERAPARGHRRGPEAGSPARGEDGAGDPPPGGPHRRPGPGQLPGTVWVFQGGMSGLRGVTPVGSGTAGVTRATAAW